MNDEFVKPTIEQVAWVMQHILQNAKEKGSYRYLIYERMGFDFDAYAPLYLAGGMDINNLLLESMYPDEFKKSTD